MIRVWEQARQQVGIPSNFQSMFSVGGKMTLWDQLLMKWIPWMRFSLPDVAIRAEVVQADALMHRLAERSVDIGVLYLPSHRSDLEVEILLDEELAMVSTSAGAAMPGHRSSVFVDWGAEFRLGHANAVPDTDTPALTVSPSHFGLSYILENGGAGYFPRRLTQRAVANGRLHLVPDMPRFHHRAHMFFDSNRKDERFNTALQGLRLSPRARESTNRSAAARLIRTGHCKNHRPRVCPRQGK